LTPLRWLAHSRGPPGRRTRPRIARRRMADCLLLTRSGFLTCLGHRL
jgi:hypothetical protein